MKWIGARLSASTPAAGCFGLRCSRRRLQRLLFPARRNMAAQDGFLFDGGHSTTIVVAPNAARVQSGTLIRGARPVATFLGIRATPIE